MKLNEIKASDALSPEHQEALNAYVAAKGHTWKSKLKADWQSGRDVNFPEFGGVLRAIRNDPDVMKQALSYKAG